MWKKKVSGWVVFLLVVTLFLSIMVIGVLGRADIAKQRYEQVNGKITPAEQLAVEKDALDAVIKILQTMGALGFFFTAYVSWKSLQHAEDKQVTERFSKAVELLSEGDKFEARIGGIYLLERVARDSPEDHPTVMEVLTAFIREQCPSPISTSCNSANKDYEEPARVRADIQAALTVIGRRISDNDKNAKLNLNGADLSNAYLYKADLTCANLVKTHLKHAYLSKADLNNAQLLLAQLDWASLEKANLSNADLASAKLSHANLCDANLCGAKLRNAILNGTLLESAKLNYADLSYANLSDASLNNADLSNANLSGTILNNADLSNANFSGAIFSHADLPKQIHSARHGENAGFDPDVRKLLEMDTEP
jgi:uncharacterized protein YjbI with pentapeptide repeats